MAIVKFSRKEFEKHVKISKEIEEKISMFGTPFESISKNEIEIEIFPNRPDLLSLQGYLRSFLFFLGKRKIKKYKLNNPEKDFIIKIDKNVKDVRPFTACAIVKGIKFDNEKIKEVIDIQEKLHSTIGRNRKKLAIGIYPLEKIKLPIRYEARKPKDIKFIPLDSDREMDGLQILQSNTGRDYANLLADKKKFPVFVDATDEILSMPPIINSQKTGKIDEKTKDIFIECSGFDFNILKKTLNILIMMFIDMKGEVYQMKLNYGKKKIITPNLSREKMKINLDNANKILGLQLSEREIKKYLERMGYEYRKSIVSVPAYRTDVLHEVDLIEDIAIAYGYDNFNPEISEVSTFAREDEKEIFKRKIANIIVGLGFNEVSSYHLISEDMIKKTLKYKDKIKTEAKTDYSILRQELLSSMLKILSSNIDSEYPQKIFEIGKVFEKNDREETGIKESDNLACFLSGNFTDIKQVLEYLGRMLNKEFKIKQAEHECFIFGRTGKIFYKDKEIGTIGEIHPKILKGWHIKMPISGFEIRIREL